MLKLYLISITITLLFSTIIYILLKFINIAYVGTNGIFQPGIDLIKSVYIKIVCFYIHHERVYNILCMAFIGIIAGLCMSTEVAYCSSLSGESTNGSSSASNPMPETPPAGTIHFILNIVDNHYNPESPLPDAEGFLPAPIPGAPSVGTTEMPTSPALSLGTLSVGTTEMPTSPAPSLGTPSVGTTEMPTSPLSLRDLSIGTTEQSTLSAPSLGTPSEGTPQQSTSPASSLGTPEQGTSPAPNLGTLPGGAPEQPTLSAANLIALFGAAPDQPISPSMSVNGGSVHSGTSLTGSPVFNPGEIHGPLEMERPTNLVANMQSEMRRVQLDFLRALTGWAEVDVLNMLNHLDRLESFRNIFQMECEKAERTRKVLKFVEQWAEIVKSNPTQTVISKDFSSE